MLTYCSYWSSKNRILKCFSKHFKSCINFFIFSKSIHFNFYLLPSLIIFNSYCSCSFRAWSRYFIRTSFSITYWTWLTIRSNNTSTFFSYFINIHFPSSFIIHSSKAYTCPLIKIKFFIKKLVCINYTNK